MKIGIFGGSFDPVHRAHLKIAENALRQFQLDQVIWVPAALSPFKKSSDMMASPEQRFEMLEIVCRAESRFKVSRFEMDQGGVSYSIKTLQHFKNQEPQAEFFWILGSDTLENIAKWRDAHTLIRELTFLVAGRGLAPTPLPHDCKVFPIEMSADRSASSELKNSLSQNRGWENLDPAVADYIRKNHLYGVGAA